MTVKKNGKSEHVEEQFIKDFKEDKFHKDSNFELYCNHTPCTKRTDRRRSCCDLLLDVLNDKRHPLEPHTVKIYGVFKYRFKGIDPTEKLCELVQNGCSIEFLTETKLKELIPLLPTKEHKEACLRAFQAVDLKEKEEREKDFENINSQ